MTAFETKFGRGQWQASDWLGVKSARFDYIGTFDQGEDHIANHCPDLPDDEIYAHHVTEVYSSMVCARMFQAKARVTCEMSFDHLMAPLIVLAPRLGKDAAGRPEFREHHEVVLYNEGINVWHYKYENGQPNWHLAAFLRAPFSARTKYALEVTVEKRRREVQMDIACGGYHFGYQDEWLYDSFYAGLTGCEGRNRFYSFKVETGLPALDAAADGEH